MNFAKLIRGLCQQEPGNRQLLWVWFAISLVVIVADLLTKKMVSDSLGMYERINVIPMFDITLRHNYGAAFSFLAGAGGWQVWFFGLLAGAVSIAIAIWILKIGTRKSLEVFGLSLILGGAVGNLYDRVTLGYVVDFLLVYYEQHQFPAFNVADAAITAGAGTLLLDAFLGAKHTKTRGTESNTDEVEVK